MSTTNTYRRLSFHSGDGTYKLTIPKEIAESLELKGKTLFFKNANGVFKYSMNEEQFTRRMKVSYQKNLGLYSMRIPRRIINHMSFLPGQQFRFISTTEYIKFNPYVEFYDKKLIGVAKKKKVLDNISKYREQQEEVVPDENL